MRTAIRAGVLAVAAAMVGACGSAPALVPSVAMHVGSYEGEVSPVPELGDDARFIAVAGQPHVLFSLGRLIVDVDASHEPTPSREAMVALAKRVREILVAANS
jgi:hypothetical protein